MHTMPISQFNSLTTNVKLPLKNMVKRTNQCIPTHYYNIVKVGAPALMISSFPMLCGEDEDNYGYGDSEYEKNQKIENENKERERNREYYGYDTPGLGSGSREVDWGN